jgi:hypothetical protein
MKKSSDNNISQYVNKYLTNKWLHCSLPVDRKYQKEQSRDNYIILLFNLNLTSMD